MPRSVPLPLAVRRRLRAGTRRWNGSWWQILQCGLGAGLAWILAQALWGQPYPVFSCFAVVVCLGVSNNQRLRRVGELGVGVSLGVLMGTLIARAIGHGPWQIAVIVVLTMAIARFLDGGNLIVNQAALQSVFILALPPAPGGGTGRWLDAMTGVVVALAIALVLPADPRRDVRGSAMAYAAHLADLLEDAARAVRSSDAGIAETALATARGTQPKLDGWAASVAAGEEVHRLSPLRRRDRPELARQHGLLDGMDRATRNLRVAIRRVSTALAYGEELPASLAGAFEELAAAIRTLGEPAYAGESVPPAVGALQELAVQLGPHTLGASSLSATVVVAQLRSAVVDLLQALGVPPEESHRLLPR